MKSLYGRYIEEREGLEIVENSHGFATYKVMDDGVYLKDMYVHPDFRREGIATILADQVVQYAKDKGAKMFWASVSPVDPNATDNLKVLLFYGMTFRHVNASLIMFAKEI